MRWKVWDPRSAQLEGTTYIPFSRTILWQCYADTMTVASGGHTDYVYTIGAASTNKPDANAGSTETQLYSDCANTYACEVYDETKESWVAASDPPIETCDATGVTYGVDVADEANF